MIMVSLLLPLPYVNLHRNDEAWRQLCASQLVEHLAVKNAERIEALCTDAAFELVPRDPAGRCFIGVPEDIAAAPGFGDAIELITGATEAHVADLEYGIGNDTVEQIDGFRGFDDLAERLGDPGALAQVKSSAAKLVEGILADARAIWNEERARHELWYGNVYQAVAGPFVDPESVSWLEDEDVPPIAEMPRSLKGYYPASFFPSGKYPFTAHDVPFDVEAGLDAEADLPRGYRVESWVRPQSTDLCQGSDAHVASIYQRWQQRGFDGQPRVVYRGPFAIDGRYFYLSGAVFRSTWQTVVVGSLGSVADGHLHIFTLSKSFESESAPDEEYAGRVADAIEGALRSMAANLCSERYPTGSLLLCSPAFESTNLNHLTTILASGFVNMPTLSVTLGAALEEAASKHYQAPVKADIIKTDQRTGDFESRIVRMSLPGPHACDIYLDLVCRDDHFFVELLTTCDFNDEKTSDVVFDAQDAVLDACDGMGAWQTHAALNEPRLYSTVLEVFLPHFRPDSAKLIQTLTNEDVPRLMGEDGWHSRVESRDEVDDGGMRVLEISLHDDEHCLTCFMRTLICGDTATMTLGILYNEGYAPCAEADGFIDNFTATGIALARTLFAVVPEGAQDTTERWSPELSIALCERCRDALGGVVEPPFLADFERVDNEAEAPTAADAAAGNEPAAEGTVEADGNAGAAEANATASEEPLPAAAAAPDASTSPAASSDEAPTPKFCYNCGSALEPGVRFCSHCGTQVAR